MASRWVGGVPPASKTTIPTQVCRPRYYSLGLLTSDELKEEGGHPHGRTLFKDHTYQVYPLPSEASDSSRPQLRVHWDLTLVAGVGHCNYFMNGSVTRSPSWKEE